MAAEGGVDDDPSALAPKPKGPMEFSCSCGSGKTKNPCLQIPAGVSFFRLSVQNLPFMFRVSFLIYDAAKALVSFLAVAKETFPKLWL